MPHPPVTIQPTQQADLAFLYTFQLDPEANYLAAFTPKDQPDLAAYVAKFSRFLHDPAINMHTIWVADTIVGSVAAFELAGNTEITYWLDHACWGQGIATAALDLFLTLETRRPLFGRVAYDNVGSQRVLEKSGFVKIGTDQGFAQARQAEITEFIYQLA